MTFKKASWVFAALWLVGIVIGFTYLLNYAHRAGPEGQPPPQWPKESHIPLGKLPKLVVFAHPRCPCSRASLEELFKIHAVTQGKLTIDVVFYHPKKFPEDWVKSSDLWNKVGEVPELTRWIDSEMYEISLFKPQTSGQAYLYSAEGKLIYAGGMTASRGHSGDNIGAETIKTWVLEGKLLEAKAHVFGCTLFHDGEEHSEDAGHDHRGEHP